jgi:hypothetical protein
VAPKVQQPELSSGLFCLQAGQQTANSSSGKAAAAGAAAGPGGSAAAVKISYCYRVPSSLRPLFGEAGRDKERLFSGAEVEEALRRYAAAAGAGG